MKYYSLLILLTLIAASLMIPDSVRATTVGDLIKCDDFTAIYYLGNGEERWVFPNEKVYYSWYADFQSVVVIPCDELASYQIGGLVTYQPGTRLMKMPSVDDVYAVESGGVLRAIPDEDTAEAIWGADWALRVDDVSEAFFPSYELGDSLDEDELPEGTVLYDQDEEVYWRIDQDGARYDLSEAVDDEDVDLLVTFALDLEDVEDALGSIDENDLSRDGYDVLLHPGLTADELE